MKLRVSSSLACVIIVVADQTDQRRRGSFYSSIEPQVHIISYLLKIIVVPLLPQNLLLR